MLTRVSEFIPFAKPSLGPEEIASVTAVLRSGWLTTGEVTHELESAFRDYTGARFALAVNSATAALHVALVALGIGPGQEVITTPLTFCATVNAILHTGATPVLADVGDDGNIDPACVARGVTGRTRAILPVHYGGHPCAMGALWSIAAQHGLHLVEDAAHAAGTLYRGVHVGSAHLPGSAAAFSFYANKNMTTGEGGMLTTNRAELVGRMRSLILHGMSRDVWDRYAEHGDWYYEVTEAGFKYNLSDVQSAIGVPQLRKLESFLEARARIAARYQELLGDVEEIELPRPPAEGRSAWHLYVIRLRLPLLSISRREFIQALRERNIGASVHFIPIPLHPCYARLAAQARNHCPRALELYERVVSLPIYPSLTDESVRYICAAVKDVLSTCRRPRRAVA